MARRRITAWWAVIVVVLALGGWGLYWLFERFSQFRTPSPVLLTALTLSLVIIALGMMGVLVRNLVRLIVDRKKGLLGSRLRTKLVFFFLALVLVPATVLFYGSAQVINRTVEAILRTPLEDLTRQSGQMLDQWLEYFETQSLHRAMGIADEIRAGDYLAEGRSEDLSRVLERWQRQDELQLVRVMLGDRLIAQVSGPPHPTNASLHQELEKLISELISGVTSSSQQDSRIAYLADGLLAQSAVPIHTVDAGPLDSVAVVAVAQLLPIPLADSVEGFASADQAYRSFRERRRELVRFYLTLIGLIFLVTLFIATWIGFYLSRRITVPIQELAAATREISVGNLGVRVRAEIGDELGTLVESFNEMAGELQENREVITRSTADLRRSNKALDERRRYIETLLANLSTAVISLDPSGRVTTANPAVEEILGLELEAGDDARAVLGVRGLEPLSELLERSLEPSAEGVRRDLSLRPGGARSKVAVQMSPLLGSTGERVGTLVMLDDLTDLMQAQRAAAWREVARRIAHEIKNPLTPIQLAAQRLRKKFESKAPDLGEVLPEATDTIEREVGALKQLVDEFSRFARMPEVTPRPVLFPEVIQSVPALYRGVPTIHWELDIDPAIGTVEIDPEQLRRALINLVDNAVAAMNGTGTIRISARHLAHDALRIVVADTGPGIPRADRDRMFVPYFSTKKRGTGLGLAIVHKVISDHRGTIRIEDNVPQGARFVIEIPA